MYHIHFPTTYLRMPEASTPVRSARFLFSLSSESRAIACMMLRHPRTFLTFNRRVNSRIQVSILSRSLHGQVSHMPSGLRDRRLHQKSLTRQSPCYFGRQFSTSSELSTTCSSSGTMSAPQTKPYGLWKSPLTAERLATCSISLHEVAVNVSNNISKVLEAYD